ncbi:MAG TPA: Rieske 2Fe-2S domain-containing protein [Aliidongia sp.]|nr:Rieske 2Fe-2S domain-containing protein [Aliidongia sp.]
MSAGFRAVQWNRHKLVYDGVLIAGVALYLICFLLLAPRLWPTDRPVTWEILRIRAVGSAVFLMLTIILSIGPLARLDRRFLPLLYNRRHFGVLTFCLALVHSWLVLDWYHGQGKLDPLVSVLSSSAHYGSFIGFPFEALGLVALAILFVMAATSHDFWLTMLSPPVWKAIHMLVYPAYALLIMHVALGAIQSDRSVLLPLLLGGAFLVVAALHGLAAAHTHAHDQPSPGRDWLEAGPAATIPEGRARIVTPQEGERIAIFRHQGKLSAVVNVCAHQNGPLGEGRIIDGCITCPWHGFQFRPEDGCAPPPFTDKVATYRLRLAGGLVLVDPRPLPPGTRVEPVPVEA